MRASHLCRGAAILGAVFLLSVVADADTPKKKGKRKKIDDEIVDVSAIKSQMRVYTDGEGGYFTAIPGDTDSMFYGDGKTLYKQRVFSGFKDNTRFSMRMWSPRVDSIADVDAKDDAGTLTCGKDKFELTRVPDPEAKKLLDKAVFKKPPWKRQAHALSRDDRGTYYYVDRLRDEHGGKGFRLFAGKKGAMKELPLTNIVSDSEGEIFSSKRGELRFVQGRTEAQWIKNEKSTTLIPVPVESNVPLIYGELGVYEGSLGTPCDEY